MSLPIKKILENLKKLNDKSDRQIDLYENGWYRIAKTTGSSRPNAIICKIGTTYNYQAPMSSIIAVTTAYQSANLEALCTVLHSSSSKHIDKIRVQNNSADNTFYIDIHYSLTNLENTAYVNFLSNDSYWKVTDNNEVTEYDTVAEISL